MSHRVLADARMLVALNKARRPIYFNRVENDLADVVEELLAVLAATVATSEARALKVGELARELGNLHGYQF